MSQRSSGRRTITVDVDAPQEEAGPTGVGLPWFIPAGLGGIAVVAAGLILLLGASTLGWLTSPDTEFSEAWNLAASLILLTHGADVALGGQLVTMQPLGLALILILLGQPIAAYAARQAAAAEGDPDDTGALWVDPEPLLWRVVGTFMGSWVVGISIVSLSVSDGSELLSVIVTGATMALIAGVWGVSRELHYDPRQTWPVWLRAVPGAMALAMLICLTGGALLLTTVLWQQRERVAALHDSLQPELAGTVLLVLIQLLYLPNLIIWATAWVLGGGLTLGDGSLISIAVTDVGFVPSIPVLGALPEPGPGNDAWLWWLVVGVLAGAAAAFAVAWLRPTARMDETTLVAGAAGAVAGLFMVLLGSLASGGLGTERLAHMGVRVRDLLIVAPSLLGLSGIVVGAVLGGIRTWLAWREAHPAPAVVENSDATEPDGGEPTVAIPSPTSPTSPQEEPA